MARDRPGAYLSTRTGASGARGGEALWQNGRRASLIDAHMLGHRETGNETYVRGLLSGLASLDGVASPRRCRRLSSGSARAGRHHVAHAADGQQLSAVCPAISPRSAERWNADVVHAHLCCPVSLAMSRRDQRA